MLSVTLLSDVVILDATDRSSASVVAASTTVLSAILVTFSLSGVGIPLLQPVRSRTAAMATAEIFDPDLTILSSYIISAYS